MFENLRLPFHYDVPIVVAGFGFVVVLLFSLEVGYRVGLVTRKKLKDGEAGGGGVVLTSMFALLGLILAFTYGFTVNRYEQRRQAVVAEANALGTAYLRAGLIEGADAEALRSAIRDYARTRLVSSEEWSTRQGAMAILNRSAKAQASLWPQTQAVVGAKPPGPIEASLVASINEVIDLHTVRLAASMDRLPSPIFWMLVLIAAASISVAGFNAGLGGFISRWRMSALTVVLAAVMLIIIDFDRPRRGFIRVSQEPMNWALSDMEKMLGEKGSGN